MYNFFYRHGQTISFSLGIGITVLSFVLIFLGIDDFNSKVETDVTRYDTTIFNFGMYAAYLMTVIPFVVVLLFAIYQVATNPKGALSGLLVLAAIAIAFGILYSIADPNTQMLAVQAKDGFIVSEGLSKFISASISLALLLTGLSFVALIVSEVFSTLR